MAVKLKKFAYGPASVPNAYVRVVRVVSTVEGAGEGKFQRTVAVHYNVHTIDNDGNRIDPPFDHGIIRRVMTDDETDALYGLGYEVAKEKLGGSDV